MKTAAWKFDLLLRVLASPFALLLALIQGTARLVRLRKAIQPTITCRTCGHSISLVGLWRCGCGYTYQGHLLRYCPVCGSFPRVIRCFHCQATEVVHL